MDDLRPFPGIRFGRAIAAELSDLIAPPYDVLDEAGKAALQAKHPNNIVSIDLPWLPPKSVGPDEVYKTAAITLDAWLESGVLKGDSRAAFYPYEQTYQHHTRTFHRRGFITTVRLSPFGDGKVVPHEKTYAAPIEDRLKLMRSTGCQLSPIFGLFSDTRGQVLKLLYSRLGLPDLDATLDGVRNQLWTVTESEIEDEVIRLMARKPIYIADGHHRYTTALQYQKEMIEKNGGPLPPNHPANFCMFVLVPMQNDGLQILPTHRILGNLANFNIAAFREAVKGKFVVTETPLPPEKVAEYADEILPQSPPNTFGLYDAVSGKLYELSCLNPDILAEYEPGQSPAWRALDVAILQRYLIDEILQPEFAEGEITKAYTAYGKEVVAKTDGEKFNIALLLKSTPLPALEALGKTGEVMPQKSTFFFPKLATGMMINPIR